MPISPGSPWGEEIRRSKAHHSFRSDREFGVALRDGTIDSRSHGSIEILDGDFVNLLGLDGSRKHDTAIKVLIDALAISYTDKLGDIHHDVCVGSLHIGRPLLGSLHIVTNTGWWRGRDIAPRAHPNDAKLDIVEVAREMTTRQRITAWKRSAVGSHLPHPHIAYSQSDFFEWTGKFSSLTIDGENMGKVSLVQCRIQSDCTEITL